MEKLAMKLKLLLGHVSVLLTEVGVSRVSLGLLACDIVLMGRKLTLVPVSEEIVVGGEMALVFSRVGIGIRPRLRVRVVVVVATAVVTDGLVNDLVRLVMDGNSLNMSVMDNRRLMLNIVVKLLELVLTLVILRVLRVSPVGVVIVVVAAVMVSVSSVLLKIGLSQVSFATLVLPVFVSAVLIIVVIFVGGVHNTAIPVSLNNEVGTVGVMLVVSVAVKVRLVFFPVGVRVGVTHVIGTEGEGFVTVDSKMDVVLSLVILLFFVGDPESGVVGVVGAVSGADEISVNVSMLSSMVGIGTDLNDFFGVDFTDVIGVGLHLEDKMAGLD